MRIFSLVHRCVEVVGQRGLAQLLEIVRLFCSARAFLTNCWAIVEAPWVAPPVMSATNARAMPRMSTPGSVQNRLSSTLTMASCIIVEIDPACR